MQDEPPQVKSNHPIVINKDQGNRPHRHGFVVSESTDLGGRPEVVSLVAMYAVLCLTWAGVAYELVPKVITAAHSEQSALNWLFPDLRSAPLEHNLDRWSVIATAFLLAIILHFGIVHFMQSIDRKHRRALLPRPELHTSIILIAFAAAFLALTILSEVRGDYHLYLAQWEVVRSGRIPWLYRPVNAYGPLFQVLAPLAWINPLANKLLFAFSYVVYVVWLVKDFAPRCGLVALSAPWLVFWLLNPFPWVEIAYFGYFDILVALACVAAVHSFIGGKDGISGIYLGLGILLKYVPAVILPFLAFSERRFRFRVYCSCAEVVIFGLGISILVWGKSTLFPLLLAATRPPQWSIYDGLTSPQSPLRLFWNTPYLDSLERLEKPLLITAGLSIFLWCILLRTGPALSAALAVLVTLLFYRVGLINYQMVFFLLMSYWVVSEWKKLIEHSALLALLVLYFVVLALLNLINWPGFTEDLLLSSLAIFKFLLGCTLLVVLAHFSASRRGSSPRAAG